MKRFKNIMFVHEPTAICEEALEKAALLAQNNQARLTVIDVVEPMPGGLSVMPKGFVPETLRHAILQERQEQLEQLVASVCKQMDVDTKVVSGIPYLEIIRNVLRDGHDLVIKPVCISGGLKTRLFGGVDLHLLRKCPVPVWLMKIPKSGKFQRILAAVDIGHDEDNARGDALSLRILELGSALALTEFGEFHIVHAWDAAGESTLRSSRSGLNAKEVDDYVADEMKRHRQWVDQLFHKATQHLGKDALNYLKPEIHLPKGSPKEVIPKLARDIDANLVVMGTVARTGLPGFIMGNTAEMIINNLDCSVLAVKPEGFVTPVTLEDE